MTAPAQVKLRVPGHDDDRHRAGSVRGHDGTPIDLHRFGMKADVRASVRVEASRGQGAPVQPVEVAGDSVLELTLEGDVRLFLRADEAEVALAGAAKRSPGDGDALGIEPVLPLAQAARGGPAGWVIKGLRALGIDLPERSACLVAQKADEHCVPAPGLFRWNGGDDAPRDAVQDGSLAGEGPCLVFLHGTASSTRGSFGRLGANATAWERLRRHYGERILALEHHTLARGPIENALDLVQRLPGGAKLHLVSHSRGGLIGELLARAQRLDAPGKPFDDLDRAAFQTRLEGHPDRDHSRQVRALEQLDAALRDKRPTVERFVRVACPARGTTLASARLDRWLNLVLNVIGWAARAGSPALGQAYEAVQAFLLAVVKERTDPRTIPGLEAMIPGSALIALLNRPGVRTAADLSTVEGDAAPSGVLQRLGLWFADAFFDEDHDLVVNRASMSGGVERSKRRSFFDQGPTVDHFSYFGNPRTAERVLAGLSRGDGEAGGFAVEAEPGDAEAAAVPPLPSRGRGPGDTRPIVYVLPGILGSHLHAGRDRIWINPARLAFGGLARLGIARPDVVPGGLVDSFYGELCRYLDRTHEVRPWPYDWRRSIHDLGAEFGRELLRALDETKDTARPVRVVAHSMGGLVARSALIEPGVWTRFRERRTGRLVQLGTPNRGSFGIVALLMGRDKLAGYLHAGDLTMTAREQLDIMRRFPGVLQMLPDDEGLNLFDRRTWEEYARTDRDDLDWPQPEAADLADAKAFQQRYANAPLDARCMVYVAGRGATLDGVTVDPLAGRGRKVLFTRTDRGDGQVLWRTGILPDVGVWYSDVAHGDLPRHAPNFAAIEELLRLGTTTKLLDGPPASVRGRLAPIAREEIEVQPATAEAFAPAALGGSAVRRVAPPVAPVRLRVVHGHLASARHPVMVGHYWNDVVAGSEAELDRALGERLSERRRLGLYAGPIATSTIVLDRAGQPRGGIVVGLGEAGGLSVPFLAHTVRQAVLAYAAAEADVHRAAVAAARDGLGADPGAGPLALGLSTLLIGADEMGLGRADALLALLQAVARARSLLADMDRAEGGAPVFLHEVEIIEAVEDRAYEIWHGLHALLKSRRELASLFDPPEDVARGPGAWRRVNADHGRDRWHAVYITMPEAERGERALSFVAGGLARAEARAVAANRDVVEPLMQRAIEGTGAADSEATPGRALFELLWPVALKERSGEDRKLRLVLDEHTARLPWELMDDRRPWTADGTLPEHGEREPPAVRVGVVRQLVQAGFRERVSVALPRGTRKALVIGDPRGVPVPGFAELPGAAHEAGVVADLLISRSYDVTRLIGAEVTPEQVMTRLFAQPWEIVHIAAHGVAGEVVPGPDGRSRPMTGVVLGGGVVMGPQILAQLSVMPRLFFVNCCHLGRVDATAEAKRRRDATREGRPGFAAGVAVELIRAGVPAVVAAGWAVEDDVAGVFAGSFYRAMLDGASLGAAVRTARADAYGLRPGGTTWGAYQCYGEPDWTLPGHPSHRGAENGHRDFAAMAEVVAVVERIREDAKIGLRCKNEELRKELQRLEEDKKIKIWLGDDETSGARQGSGQLRVALGEAYTTLGDVEDVEKAIQHYEIAQRSADTEYKVKAIEQLAYLRAWRDALLFKTQTAGPASAGAGTEADAVAKAIEARLGDLRKLVDLLGATQERWALQGFCQRRLAQVWASARQWDKAREALEEMERCYRNASEQRGPERDRAVLLACAARIASRRRGSDAAPDAQAEKDRAALDGLKAAYDGEDADFARQTLALDARVLLALSDGTLEDGEGREILKNYARAWRKGGSAMKRMTALEVFEFLEDVMGLDGRAASGDPADGGGAPNGTMAAIRRLRETLTERFMQTEPVR